MTNTWFICRKPAGNVDVLRPVNRIGGAILLLEAILTGLEKAVASGEVGYCAPGISNTWGGYDRTGTMHAINDHW